MSPARSCFSLLILLGLAISAGANWDKKWDRIQVDAHLLDSGAVEVVERMTAILEGDMDTLERPLSTGPDQAIVLRRLIREDSDGEQILSDGNRSERDRYDFTNGVLTWGIRAPDGEWKGEAVTFRLEYELRNALSPAWDIPMSADRFGSWGEFKDFPGRIRAAFTKWGEAGTRVAKRYRYEHEIRFPPFPATGPRETNYNIKYDKAWRLIFPERDLGRGSDECYRVALLFDFLPPGAPTAIDFWKPAVRIGSIALVIFVTIALSILWIFSELPVRGIWKGRTDYEWFAQHIAPIQSEALAWFAGRSVGSHFADFLARMKAAGVLTLTEKLDAEDEVTSLTMTRRNEPASLVPYEREMLNRLFPKGNECSIEVLAEHYKNEGFDPGEELGYAVSEQFAEPVQPVPVLWRVLGAAIRPCMLAGIALMFFAVFSGGHDWRAAMRILMATFALGIIPIVLRSLNPGTKASLPIFLPSTVAALFCLALVLQQFATHLPLTVWSSLGAALICMALIIGPFRFLRTEESVPLTLRRRDAARATGYARRQLRSARPALSDAWIPHLLALGLGAEIGQWRSRSGAASLTADTQMHDRPPFTGTAAIPSNPDWEYVLTVPEPEDGSSRAGGPNP